MLVNQAQKIIGGYAVILAKANEVTDRQFVCAPFVSCIHRLRGAEQ